MTRSRVLCASMLTAGALLLAACGGSADEPANAGADEELTGIHAGETPEEHAAHVEQDRLDQLGEEAAAEAASRAAEEAASDQ